MTQFPDSPSELGTRISFHVQDDRGTMTMNLETISISCYMMSATVTRQRETQRFSVANGASSLLSCISRRITEQFPCDTTNWSDRRSISLWRVGTSHDQLR